MSTPRHVYLPGDRVRATRDGHLVEGVITGGFPREGVTVDPSCALGTADVRTPAGIVVTVPLATLEPLEDESAGRRDSRAPNAGRVVARAFMYLAGIALLVLGAFSYHSDRITLRDVIGLVICVVVYAVAALWHRRLRGGGQQ